MSTQQAAPSPGRANLALASLFSGMFELGSAELLVVGVRLEYAPEGSGPYVPNPEKQGDVGRGILRGVPTLSLEENEWTSISRHLTTTKCHVA